MSRLTRTLTLLGGVALLLLAAGFYLQFPAVTAIWPWEDSRLSYIFLASICAAVGAPVIWIALADVPATLRGGALNLSTSTLAITAYFFWLYSQRGTPALLMSGLASAAFCAFSIALFRWSGKFTLRDQRPFPRPVFYSFILFILALLFAATLLVARHSTVFPWPLNPDSSVIYGLLFYGNAAYFLYGLLLPAWDNARGQLIAFLAYDLVLLGPFFALLGAVKPGHRLSLAVYLIVLIYSSLLAAYYLFLHPATRFSRTPAQEK